MAKFWHATMDTPSFRFDAYGVTKTEARTALHQAWNRHREQTGATTEDPSEYGINYIHAELGKGYRDYKEVQ